MLQIAPSLLPRLPFPCETPHGFSQPGLDGVGDRALINNDFCEACQSGGRLLLCERCPRAFHVQCIERLVDFESVKPAESWCCPVCLYGESILRGKVSNPVKDLFAAVESFFVGDALAQQPRVVVDLDLDAKAERLTKIFEMELPRGKMLKEFPLTMVGISSHEEALVTPKIALCVKRIPHKVLSGDPTKPASILAALMLGADHAVHRTVRPRPAAETGDRLSAPTELFARQALAEEKLPSATAAFAALVGGMEISAQLAERAIGLVLVETQPLPPVAHAMAAAMTGEVTFTQLLVWKGYKARFAECHDYGASSVKNLQHYVDMHVNGRVNDRILTFHTSYGAKVLGLVPNFRPEDGPKEWLYDPSSQRPVSSGKSSRKKHKEPQIPALDILSGIMTDMGYEIDMENLDLGFFASGLDSFDMGVIQNRLGRALGKTLPATLMLDLPTVKELTEQLDKDRGLGAGSDPASREESATGSASDGSGGEGERASDDSITEWVRSWRQYLYEKTKVKRAEQRARSGTPRGRRSLSAGRRRESPWEKIQAEELGRIQRKLQGERLKESQMSFFCDLRPVLDSIIGPPLLAMGLVQDTKPRSLQDARDDMESQAQALGGECATQQKELSGLMKLDHLDLLPTAPRAVPVDDAGDVRAAALRCSWPPLLRPLLFQLRMSCTERSGTAPVRCRNRPEKRSRAASIRQRDVFLLQHWGELVPFASRPALTRMRKAREAAENERRPRRRRRNGTADGTERSNTACELDVQLFAPGIPAIVLSQTSPAVYLVADLVTKTQELREEKWLLAYLPGQRGGDVPDFLSFARRPIVSETTTLKEYQQVGVNWLIQSEAT
eukprot:g27238.t1